jgi:hypothetical protein
MGLAYRGARPAWLTMAQPTWAFWSEAGSRGALSPIGTSGLPAESGRPTAGGRGSSGRGASPGNGDFTVRLGNDGRLTKEAGDGEVLDQRVRAGERLEEQPRVPARGSREFTASVQSSGRCWGVHRGTKVSVRSGSTTASTAAQWWQRGGRGRRVTP